MFYVIGETLEVSDFESCRSGEKPYAAVLNMAEWQQMKDSFDLGIDLEMNLSEIYGTKAEVNYDSLTGTFSVPDRKNLSGNDAKFAFALDEKGVIFIDESGYTEKVLRRIHNTKRWKIACIERFLYDFLELIVHDDLRLMEKYERELTGFEVKILERAEENHMNRIYEIRRDIRELRIHYEQLIDLGQELEENENNFFREMNLRYFRMFTNRMQRLFDNAAYLRDYTVQLGDIYHMQLEAQQNRTITVLTVVSTIFMPLTLIVGWYGMNFKYMPELDDPWAYPAVIIVSLLVIAVSLYIFKKKKLL